jgi:hypothetical protein
MAELVKIDELNAAIMESLETYNEAVVTGLKEITTQAMKDLVKTTKATAPVGNRNKHYRDSISSRTERETQYGIVKLWYVKGSDYRLSHLLNNGHALRGGGRYPGTNFIENAVDVLIPVYLSKIEEVLKNG